MPQAQRLKESCTYPTSNPSGPSIKSQKRLPVYFQAILVPRPLFVFSIFRLPLVMTGDAFPANFFFLPRAACAVLMGALWSLHSGMEAAKAAVYRVDKICTCCPLAAETGSGGKGSKMLFWVRVKRLTLSNRVRDYQPQATTVSHLALKFRPYPSVRPTS